MIRIVPTIRAVLAMALLVASTNQAVAQRRGWEKVRKAQPSHVEIPEDELATGLGRWLRRQNGGMKNPFDSELFRKLLPDLNDPSEIAKWIDKNPNMLDGKYRKQ